MRNEKISRKNFFFLMAIFVLICPSLAASKLERDTLRKLGDKKASVFLSDWEVLMPGKTLTIGDFFQDNQKQKNLRTGEYSPIPGSLYYIPKTKNRNSNISIHDLRELCLLIPDHGFSKILVDDSPLRVKARKKKHNLGANASVGLLSFLDIDLDINGEIEVEFSLSNVRRRLLDPNVAKRMFETISAGSTCKNEIRRDRAKNVAENRIIQLVGYSYGIGESRYRVNQKSQFGFFNVWSEFSETSEYDLIFKIRSQNDVKK